MNTKPTVGQRVRLNDHGLDAIWCKTQEAIKQAQAMTITHVDDESMTEPEDTWLIEVDQPIINQFLIDHTMVDPL